MGRALINFADWETWVQTQSSPTTRVLKNLARSSGDSVIVALISFILSYQWNVTYSVEETSLVVWSISFMGEGSVTSPQ